MNLEKNGSTSTEYISERGTSEVRMKSSLWFAPPHLHSNKESRPRSSSCSLASFSSLGWQKRRTSRCFPRHRHRRRGATLRFVSLQSRCLNCNFLPHLFDDALFHQSQKWKIKLLSSWECAHPLAPSSPPPPPPPPPPYLKLRRREPPPPRHRRPCSSSVLSLTYVTQPVSDGGCCSAACGGGDGGGGEREDDGILKSRPEGNVDGREDRSGGGGCLSGSDGGRGRPRRLPALPPRLLLAATEWNFESLNPFYGGNLVIPLARSLPPPLSRSLLCGVADGRQREKAAAAPVN